jgi:hypothetical protein
MQRGGASGSATLSSRPSTCCTPDTRRTHKPDGRLPAAPRSPSCRQRQLEGVGNYADGQPLHRARTMGAGCVATGLLNLLMIVAIGR